MDKEGAAIIALLGLAFAVSFSLFSFSVFKFVVGGLFGAYVGFAALPFFDSSRWQPRPVACGLLGAVGCALLAVSRSQGPLVVLISGLVGGLVGLFAPWWAKYL